MTVIAIVALFAVFLSIGGTDGQTVKQCLCSQVEPCTKAFLDSWQPCMDSCQHNVATLGANYQKLKACMNSKASLIQSVITCSQSHYATACAKSPASVKQVPKRYTETLEVAMMSEINKMINSMGLGDQAKEFMNAGKKMFGCVRKCMSKKAGNCEKKLGCGLDLPPDNVVVQGVKQCALKSGFNTANAQQLCKCAADAGVKNLSTVCPKIKIT